MTKNKRTQILLQACPRCHGDLFPDHYEEDLACLQCGRRFTYGQLEAARAAEKERALAPAA